MSDDRVGDGDGDADANANGRSPRYYVDGDLVPAESTSVPATDHGFLYDDAASRTLRVYNGKVFHWDTHVDRLAEMCDALGMDHGLSDSNPHVQIGETLATNGLDETYIRLSVTRGGQGGRLTPAEAVDPRAVVIMEPLSRGGRGSDPARDGPAMVQMAKTRHIPGRSLPARTKTHSYLNDILACAELHVTGADEAFMLDADGYVTEGATSNLFFVDGNMLCIPSLDRPVLPGITRRVALNLVRQGGILIRERRFTPDDARDANEAFLTNSTWELRPIEAVDGTGVGDGPVTKLLLRFYGDCVERRHYGDDRGSGDADNGGGTDSVGGDEN